MTLWLGHRNRPSDAQVLALSPTLKSLCSGYDPEISLFCCPCVMESNEQAAKPNRRHRFVLVMPLLVLILLPVGWLIASQYQSIAIEVGPDTTYLSEPLGSDGFPNYVAHLHRERMRGMAIQDNGAVPFWNANGCDAILPEHRDWYFAELGMSVPDSRTSRFDVDTAAAVAFVDAGTRPEVSFDAAKELLSRPWRRSELPELADWIDTHADDFALLYEASEKPRLVFPSPDSGGPNSVTELTFPHLPVLRATMRNLAARAMLRTGEGDRDAAWRDLQVMLRISTQMEAQSLIEWLVKVATYQVALAKTSRLVELETDPDRLDRIDAFVTSLPPIEGIDPKIDQFERMSYLNLLVDLSRDRMTIEEFTGTGGMNTLALDWNQILRRGNAAFDSLVQAIQADEPERAERLADWESEFIVDLEDVGLMQAVRRRVSLRARSKMISDLFINLMMPPLTSSVEIHDNVRTETHLFRLRIALNRSRCQEGMFPNSLGELDLSESQRIDPVNGRPIQYVKTDNGFLLYSFGINGEDDRGANRKENRYRGVSIGELADLLSEREIVELEDGLSKPRSRWTDEDFEALTAGDDVSARSPYAGW